MYDAGEHTVQEIADTFGVSRPMIRRPAHGRVATWRCLVPRQLPLRVTHTRVTGRPPVGRSRTHTGRRACGRADTTHEAHRATLAVDSTACSSSPSRSETASSTSPSSPSNTVPALRVSITWGLPTRVLDTTILRPQARLQGQDRSRTWPRSPSPARPADSYRPHCSGSSCSRRSPSRCSWQITRVPTPRQASGGGPPPKFHESRDNLGQESRGWACSAMKRWSSTRRPKTATALPRHPGDGTRHVGYLG